jgi:predicted RNA-binding Zn ribbon-like protein
MNEVVLRSLDRLEMVGGALCLDFANTVNSRIAPAHDYLGSYADLLGWAAKAGAIDGDEVALLAATAERQPGEASAALEEAGALRETIYRVFASTAAGAQPAEADLAVLWQRYAAAIAQARPHLSTNVVTLAWDIGEDLRSVLWPVAYSAGELLRSAEMRRVKECPGCGWLFVDASKNGSRRWCNMNTCGARDKMRRYHRRARTSRT